MITFVALIISLGVSNVHGMFYLPGVVPHSYEEKESVKLYVTKLTSTKTQIPYDYYALPFCQPKKIGLQHENIGEAMSGDRIENSVYKVNMKETKSCAAACAKKLGQHDSAAFKKAIAGEYRAHWIIDNLPVGSYESFPDGQKVFNRGFPIGFTVPDPKKSKTPKYYLNNHFRIILQYHDNTAQESEMELSRDFASPVSPAKIVGFHVQPMSVRHAFNDQEFTAGKTILSTCNSNIQPSADDQNFQTVNRGDTIVFTYDVLWEATDVEWTQRWDVYVSATSAPDDKVHMFAITNSILVVIFLSIMIAMILLRALRKDIAKYNDPEAIEEAKEESGWKLVHGDVFRPPVHYPMLFSVFVGSGVQLFFMCGATLTFALLGLLSPDNRGSLGTGLVFLFVFMGSFAGYYSSRTYKLLRGTDWNRNTTLTAFFFPSVLFSVFSVINVALMYQGSSGALPFSAMFTLLFLWLCVSVPLVFLGSFYGYRKDLEPNPVRTNQIPRAIPEQPWYMSIAVTSIICGVLPFAAVSVEVSFIMSALWLHQIYYIFGFLFLVMIVLVITCAEVSILLCYFQLKFEDYHWWWRSFLSGGACSGYLFLYALWYNLTSLDMSGSVAFLIYFGYMSLICLTFFLITGTIGYFSCLWFNWQIYGSIKVD